MHESITTRLAIIVNIFSTICISYYHFIIARNAGEQMAHIDRNREPLNIQDTAKTPHAFTKAILTHSSFCAASWRLTTTTYKSFDKSSDIIRSHSRSVCKKSSLRRLRASATQIFHLSREVGAWLRNGYLEISHLANAICRLFRARNVSANCKIRSWFRVRVAVAASGGLWSKENNGARLMGHVSICIWKFFGSHMFLRVKVAFCGRHHRVGYACTFSKEYFSYDTILFCYIH